MADTDDSDVIEEIEQAEDLVARVAAIDIETHPPRTARTAVEWAPPAGAFGVPSLPRPGGAGRVR